MAHDNEITAVESMGLPKSIVVGPAIVMAFMLSLFAVWLNDISYAWSHWGVERVVLESTDKIVYSVLQKEGSFKSDQFSIEVDGVQGHKLIQPTVIINSGNDSSFTMTASSGSLVVNPERHSLQFTLDHGLIDNEGSFKLVDGEMSQYEIPLKSPDDLAKATGNPSHLYLSQINDEIEIQEIRLNALRADLAIDALGQWMTGDFVGLTHGQWERNAKEFEEQEYRYSRLHVVPHRRWANGFSCLAFALIGIPVAMRLKAGNYATTFGVCFLPILLLYYPLFMYGLNGAKMGTLPPYSAWLGNVACGLIGVVLLVRELRR
jgi:lipopolysaccharide export system permease protein